MILIDMWTSLSMYPTSPPDTTSTSATLASAKRQSTTGGLARVTDHHSAPCARHLSISSALRYAAELLASFMDKSWKLSWLTAGVREPPKLLRPTEPGAVAPPISLCANGYALSSTRLLQHS